MISQPRTGRSSLSDLREVLRKHNVQRLLLVAGPGGWEGSGAAHDLQPLLNGIEIARFKDFDPSPKCDRLSQCLGQLRSIIKPDAILAVGGGTAIDYAKLIKSFWHGDVSAWIRGEHKLAPLEIPIFAVPTTAGSGSEATQFAVVFEGSDKYSVTHPNLRPEEVWLVPEYLVGAPERILSSAGIDALCQAIESWWSIHATDESMATSERAFAEVWAVLPEAIATRDLGLLNRLLVASNLAGQAIQITRTTAPHAVSYPLTALFGVPHGHAVGLVMPVFLQFNAGLGAADALDPRGADHSLAVLARICSKMGAGTSVEAVRRLRKWLTDSGLDHRLSQHGVRCADDVTRIVRHGFNPERVNNNPRRLTAEALTQLLSEQIKR
jgi:alcohol dehydrogenase